MLEMKNGFVITDDDCMQCRKDLENRKYLFIQAIWMDGEDKYCVVANTEDVSKMSLNDIEIAICGFYDDIKDMETKYDEPLGQLDWLVAECSFENHPYCDWEYQSEIVTWKQAEEIIQKFIDTNGEVFFENVEHDKEPKHLNLSEEQKEILNTEWNGDELCGVCGCETSFNGFNPMRTELIICKHCGKQIHPCSLCDSALCGEYETCQDSIRASLLIYNGYWDEKINGKKPEGVDELCVE